MYGQAMTNIDVDEVDWLAVEFVCSGTPMRLGDNAATLSAAVLAIGYDLTVEQTAERLGTTTRRVLRILDRHGAKVCPNCKRRLVLRPGDVVPPHLIHHGPRHECRMSGYHFDDSARLAEIRSDSQTIGKLR